MLGLDGAGKTSILYRMILNEDVTNLTGQKDGFVGLRCGLEPLNIIPGLNLQICDLDGSKNARSLWMNYISRQGHKNGRSILRISFQSVFLWPIKSMNGLIWVVDSEDRDRFKESRDELMNLLQSDCIRGQIPILLLANKQDRKHALHSSDVARFLEFHKICTKDEVMIVDAIN